MAKRDKNNDYVYSDYGLFILDPLFGFRRVYQRHRFCVHAQVHKVTVQYAEPF